MPDVLDGEIVEIQLPLELRDLIVIGVDRVDPDPRPVIEAGDGAPEIRDGHAAGLDRPVPDDVCLHRRSVPRSQPNPAALP